MPVSDENQRPVAWAMASFLACGDDQSLDFGWSEMLTTASFQVGDSARRGNFPIFDGWRVALGTLECQDSAHRFIPIFPIKRRFRASAPNTTLELPFGQARLPRTRIRALKFVREAVGEEPRNDLPRGMLCSPDLERNARYCCHISLPQLPQASMI